MTRSEPNPSRTESRVTLGLTPVTCLAVSRCRTQTQYWQAIAKDWGKSECDPDGLQSIKGRKGDGARETCMYFLLLCNMARAHGSEENIRWKRKEPHPEPDGTWDNKEVGSC